jgi:tetratricopeptide (TPR) repeat protein
VIGGIALALGVGCSRPEGGAAGAGSASAPAKVAKPAGVASGRYGAKEVGAGQVVGREQAEALTRGARIALEQRNFDGAVEMSRNSVSIDATDAHPYLYWGTALIELDRRTEARQVFIRCSRDATRGPLAECQKFLQ